MIILICRIFASIFNFEMTVYYAHQVIGRGEIFMLTEKRESEKFHCIGQKISLTQNWMIK